MAHDYSTSIGKNQNVDSSSKHMMLFDLTFKARFACSSIPSAFFHFCCIPGEKLTSYSLYQVFFLISPRFSTFATETKLVIRENPVNHSSFQFRLCIILQRINSFWILSLFYRISIVFRKN